MNLKEVIQEIKPSKEDEEKILGRVRSIVEKISSKDIKAELGGSGAKGTWLKSANDADIFACFDYKKYRNKSAELSNILEKILKKSFSKISRLHGSRDYFQIKQKDFTFEIIPILNIKRSDEAVNITDVSPLHAKWVLKNKKYADEIRLTKQFCKAIKIYGAESYIKGFSGYMCEVLTIYYKGFINLLRNASKWKEKVIIDINGSYKDKNVLFELNKSKTYSPLILIDPVQDDRNAAAVLSEEKFGIFKEKARGFLRKPSKRFFEIEKLSVEGLKSKTKGNDLIILDVKPKKGKVDVAGSKMLKVFEFVKKEVVANEFRIFKSNWEWDQKKEAIFYFILENEKLSKVRVHEGPPLKIKEGVKRFKKKHKNTFVKGNRIYAKIGREFTEPKGFIKKIIKDDYVKDRVKEIKIE